MKAEHVAPVPDLLDLSQAGTVPTTGLTALQGIDNELRVRRAETVLIYGASGAVGTLAVQFAKRWHARVLATGTGRDASALLRRLGADAVVDARSEESVDQLRKLAPDKIDAALLLASGKTLTGFLDFVRPGGPSGLSERSRAGAPAT